MSESIQASGQPQDPADQELDPKKNTVAYETHQKLLGEKKKRDEELRQAREALSKFESEKKALEEQSLKEKEDYKRLFEARDNEAKQEREKRLAIESQINDSKKMRSFLQAAGPVEEEFWDLIDLDKIALDPTTGKPDDNIVKGYADEFKKKYWKIFDTSTGRMPNDGPARGQSGLSYEQWLKLPLGEQKKRIKDVI